jgi:hypothetical protein
MASWVAGLLVIALGAFTVYRLVRSWRGARRRLQPPGPGSM